LGASAEAESYHLGGFLSQFLCVAKACGQGPRFSYSSRVITQGFDFIAVMFGICGVLVAIEQRSRAPFFRWFPSIVLVMFASMALYTAGLWEMTDEIRLARTTVRDNLIPAMLFLMSLRFNLVVIRKLGARLIALCLASTLSIMIGFVVVHELMSPFLGDETPLTFATMSAGWTGGTQNFVAVKEALSVTDAAMTYTLLMGALCYSVWLVIIIAMKPFKEKFAGFLRADDSGLNDILNSLADVDISKPIDMQALMLILGLSLVVAALSNHLGAALAGSGLLNPMIWTIIISSALGMLAAPTWLGRTAGSDEVSGVMLYVIVALIGAEVSLSAIVQAPMYILSGFMILTIHVTILLFIARMLRMNLHLTAIASIANIGSAPSAAVVGAAYGRHLVPVAIIMALIGSMVGSFVGLGVAEILSWFAVK
jgi:uncharacterized membrane protein